MLRRYVARTLGTTPQVAALLIARSRAYHGTRFAPYATLFLLATARPFAAAIPRRLRRPVIVRFVTPMLDSAPAGLSYVSGEDVHMLDPCQGMRRP